MIDRETGLWIYNKMNEIRDFEETACSPKTSCGAPFIYTPARKLWQPLSVLS